MKKLITVALLIGVGAFFYQQYRASKPLDVKLKTRKKKNGN
jgi:hypothetical protein